jgi:conjugal transfer pilin signal peptidase TrbI
MPEPEEKKATLGRRRYLRRAGVLAVCLLGGPWFSNHLMFTQTESLRDRLYFVRSASAGEHFTKHSFVLFPLSHPYFKNGKRELATKVVRCVPGEDLVVTESREYFCEGEFLGRAFEKDSKGTVLPWFRWNGSVPEGKLFVLGQHERSFDGRYFGFVDEAKVLGRAYPLL